MNNLLQLLAAEQHDGDRASPLACVSGHTSRILLAYASQYHSAVRRIPSLRRTPSMYFAFVTSAHVYGTSPGWSGVTLITASFPVCIWTKSINSFSKVLPSPFPRLKI